MSSVKRSACDRCRDQKLRCCREKGASCVRCNRAGATCTTSNPKPMGRPLRKPLYSNAEHSYSWVPTATPQTTPGNDHSMVMTPNGSQQNAFVPGRSPRYQSESTMHLRPQTWEAMMPEVQTDDLSINIDDFLSFLGPTSASNSGDLLQEFLDQSNAPAPSVLLTPQDSAQQSPGQDNTLPSPESEFQKDPLYALSKLNHFLVECHLLLQNQTCSPPLRISTIDPDLPREARLDENPVGTLLRSTNEFIDIVAAWSKRFSSYQSTESNKRKDQRRPLNSFHLHPATYTLNKPTVLMMITTYLLFIRLFDVIFSRLIFALQNFPGEIDKVRFEPGFKLGSFSLPQGFFILKIIVQALEHQLERIESLLGLPAEYRVSVSGRLPERQRESSGVFDNPKYQSLFRAAMMEGLEDTNDEENEGNAGPNNHSEVLRLRAKMIKVKELLSGL